MSDHYIQYSKDEFYKTFYDDDYDLYPLEDFPQQLVHKDFCYSQWSDALEAEDGLYAMLEEGERIYNSPFSFNFQRYINEVCPQCGIVVGYGGLVALVLHNPEHFWKINADLGATCCIFNEQRKAVTLFYKVNDISLPTMTYIRRMSQEQEKNFKLLVEQNSQEAIMAPQMRRIFSLITNNHTIGLTMDVFGHCHTKEPVKEIFGADLLECLSYYAVPYPAARAYYFEGKESVEFEGMTVDVGPLTSEYILTL